MFAQIFQINLMVELLKKVDYVVKFYPDVVEYEVLPTSLTYWLDYIVKLDIFEIPSWIVWLCNACMTAVRVFFLGMFFLVCIVLIAHIVEKCASMRIVQRLRRRWSSRRSGERYNIPMHQEPFFALSTSHHVNASPVTNNVLLNVTSEWTRNVAGCRITCDLFGNVSVSNASRMSNCRLQIEKCHSCYLEYSEFVIIDRFRTELNCKMCDNINVNYVQTAESYGCMQMRVDFCEKVKFCDKHLQQGGYEWYNAQYSPLLPAYFKVGNSTSFEYQTNKTFTIGEVTIVYNANYHSITIQNAASVRVQHVQNVVLRAVRFLDVQWSMNVNAYEIEKYTGNGNRHESLSHLRELMVSSEYAVNRNVTFESEQIDPRNVWNYYRAYFPV
jgi:hypothetical protein